MNTKLKIPASLIELTAELMSNQETANGINMIFNELTKDFILFQTPVGNKKDVAASWLRSINEEAIDPLKTFGSIIEKYMECRLDEKNLVVIEKYRQQVKELLSDNNFKYALGGIITISSKLAPSSRDLENFIRGKKLEPIEIEFNRAIDKVEREPREALSAASNILETVCKVYIDDEKLPKPKKQDLKSVWDIIRKDLNFDPSRIEDEDLKRILSGLISIVDGIGALRTHSSSAHGPSRKSYKLDSRHVRLAINSSHAVALFILESWDKKK